MNPAAQSPLLVQRERLWPLVVVSAALHVALGAAALLHRPSPQIDLGQKPIVAKLVRLGEKRPPNLLPRKEEPAAPAPAPAPAPVAEPKPAAPAPAPKVAVPSAKPAPRPVHKPSRPAPSTGGQDVLASVLSRVKRDRAREEPIYGDPNGSPMGDASEGSPGDQYLALVERTLRETYTLPSTISERDRLHLKATVVLYIESDGRVLRHAFEESSGNAAFDAALERAIRAARLPPPPPELRQKYRSEGLGVVYRP